MDNYVFVVFDTEVEAYDGLKSIKRMHAEGSVSLYEWAVIEKSASSGWLLKEASNPNAGMGTLVGSLAGALVGLIGGPVGAAIGLSTGGLIGMIGDVRQADVSNEFVRQAADAMAAGNWAILASVAETWEAPLEIEMEATGGRLLREPQFLFEAEKAQREADARRAELERLKSEFGRASAEQRGKIEKHIERATEKLKSAVTRLEEQADKATARAEQRLSAIAQQITVARADRKEALEQRLAEGRADLEARNAKMRQALDLAGEALRPHGHDKDQDKAA